MPNLRAIVTVTVAQYRRTLTALKSEPQTLGDSFLCGVISYSSGPIEQLSP